MIDLTRTYEHLAWADARFYADLAALPDEALQARYAPEAWTVGRLAMHIVAGAQWCSYCLTGRPRVELSEPETMADVAALAAQLAELDAFLAEQVHEADEVITFTSKGEERTARRSSILTQAYLHSLEHRAQISCALEAAGYDGFTLDDYDLWRFEAAHAGD